MSRKLHCILAVMALTLVAGGGVAMAQRQTQGRSSVEGYGSVGLNPFEFAGGGLLWCNHGYSGRTSIGLDVFREGHYYAEEAVYDNYGELVAPRMEHAFVATDVSASLGYMFRLLAPRNRVVILSGGGHLLAGAKYAKQMSGFEKSAGKNYSSAGVYIALVPELQFEVFPAKNFSLYAAFRPRVRVMSGLGGYDDGWYLFTGAFGMKYYL